MLQTLSNIIFSVIIAALVVYVIKLRNHKTVTERFLAKVINDQGILRQELEKAITASGEKSIEQTEGFLKFVSDSRDWAFKYIEDVQSKLQSFTDTAGPILAQGKKDKKLNLDTITKLSEAYKDIESLLPKE